MAEAKTKPTAVSPQDHLARIEDPERRADCQALVDLMRQVTRHEPVMWGPGIVGFGHYKYTYASGHSGESCAVGFANRKGDISVYLMAGTPDREALLGRLGKHKAGKGCLYIKRLADIHVDVLEQLVAGSCAAINARYPA